MNIGNNYRRVTVSLPSTPTIDHPPGVCAKVNGHYLAAAEILPASNAVRFVVKDNSFLLSEDIASLEFPVGRGYQHVEDPRVYCLVGGTGLAAAVSLVAYRRSLGLSTSVMMYGRGVDKSTVVDAFPILRGDEFGCWDTTRWGRPSGPLALLAPPAGCHLFFAGPKDLLAAVERDPSRPTIHHNY